MAAAPSLLYLSSNQQGASKGFNGDVGREVLPETGAHSITAVLVPTLDLGHLAIHIIFNFLETQV